jgi:hypothetical protein
LLDAAAAAADDDDDSSMSFTNKVKFHIDFKYLISTESILDFTTTRLARFSSNPNNNQSICFFKESFEYNVKDVSGTVAVFLSF